MVSPSGGTILTRSQLEARVLNDLSDRGVLWSYESERLNYTTNHHYTPDIILRKKSGGIIMIEVKGLFTGADRSKLLSVRNQNPNIDLRLLFSRAETRISKTSVTTYGGWCTNKGFQYAEGRVPESWVGETN